MAKNFLPATAGDVRDTGSVPESEGPLEEGMETHSSILALGELTDRGAGAPQSSCCKESNTTTQHVQHSNKSVLDLLYVMC